MAMGKVTVERRQRLLDICKHVVDNPLDVDGDIKARLRTAAFKYAHTQYDDPTQVLKRLYLDDGELGSLLRKAVDVVTKQRARYNSSWESDRVNQINRARFDALDQNEELLGQDDEDKEPDEDADDEEIEKQADHHASTVADLLVEAGSFPHRAAALHHLLHKPYGQALLARMHKAAETAKEKPMSPIEPLEKVVKAHGVAGIVEIAKNFVETEKTLDITEEEFVKLIDTAARVAHPELGALAFEKIYANNPILARAINVIKAMSLEPLVAPGVSGFPTTRLRSGSSPGRGDDAGDLESDAYAQLTKLAEQQRRAGESASQAFERVYLDPANRHLAEAERSANRPQPTTQYPFPR
jgi:hypothetical protein